MLLVLAAMSTVPLVSWSATCKLAAMLTSTCFGVSHRNGGLLDMIEDIDEGFDEQVDEGVLGGAEAAVPLKGAERLDGSFADLTAAIASKTYCLFARGHGPFRQADRIRPEDWLGSCACGPATVGPRGTAAGRGLDGSCRTRTNARQLDRHELAAPDPVPMAAPPVRQPQPEYRAGAPAAAGAIPAAVAFAVLIRVMSTSKEPASARAGQALTRAPIGPWPRPCATLAPTVAVIPAPRHHRASGGTGWLRRLASRISSDSLGVGRPSNGTS